MNRDKINFQLLSKDEKSFILAILSFFAASDGIVTENIATNFFADVQLPEARCFYGFQLMMENIHSEMYSIMIDTLAEPNEKDNLYNAVKTNPTIKKKADWCKKYMDKCKPFALRLIAFACVEAIFFSASFCAIYWLKKRGVGMDGLCFSNELISRDEALHCEFAIELHRQLLASTKDAVTAAIVYMVVQDAVTIEIDFICNSIPCRMIGMNKILMSRYVQFCGDRLLVQLGYGKLYGVQQPFDFMEMISLEGKTNFFEKKVGEYALSNKAGKSDCFEDVDFGYEF